MPVFGQGEESDTIRLGWDTTGATRPKMLQDLKDGVESKVYTVYDKPTIQEMFNLVLVQTTSTWKAQAESGSHDDLVMSLAGAIQLAQMCKKPDSENIIDSAYEDIPPFTSVW